MFEVESLADFHISSVMTFALWRRRAVLFTLPLVLAMTSLAARIFVSEVDGSEFEGELIGVDARERVTIKRADGQVFKDVPIEKFSSKDRAYIRKWKQLQQDRLNNFSLEEDSRIRVTVATGRRRETFNEYGYIYHIVGYEPKVEIKNEEIGITYSDIKGTLIMVGKHERYKDQYGVIFRENFKMTAPPKETSVWLGKPFQQKISDWEGFAYEGYILVLRDHDGKVVYSKSSRNQWLERLQALSKADLFHAYDRDFKMELMY